MMTILGNGQLRLGTATPHSFHVEGGFLQVAEDHVRVVTEKASAA
jgi:F-type H+-transporting ATPase subunit epsilon